MATWSPLTDKIRESGDNSGNRTYKVTRITPHCWVGQVSIENGLDYFATSSRQVSSNYIIGSDGRVGGCVREEWRAWTSSSRDNDQRAITIECASGDKSPYTFNAAVYDKLIKLSADICKRYGKKKLLWISDKTKALNYSPKDDEMILTVHRWFSDTDCPGSWLMGKMGDLATQVTAILSGDIPKDTYTVKTNGDALRLRKEPTTKSTQVGYIDNGTTFTSKEVVEGEDVGGVNTWVKYGAGYASGKYLTPTPIYVPEPEKYKIELTELRLGSEGGEVYTLQILLNELGCKGKDGNRLKYDRIFGENTEYALKQYQTTRNLKFTGICDEATWNRILK